MSEIRNDAALERFTVSAKDRAPRENDAHFAGRMIDFRQLKVWQKAHVLTVDVYRVTNRELRRDRSLAAQTRRAAGSVTANIVEGCGAFSQAELGRFLQISLSSAIELEYHLLLAHDLAYIPTARYEQLRSQVQEVKRMLTGFRRTVRSRQEKSDRDAREQRGPLTPDI